MSLRPAAGRVAPTTAGAPAVPSYAREDLLAAVQKLAPAIREASDEIERGRTLPEPVVQAMVDAGLYRMFLPRSLGGGEIDPMTYFDVVLELTRADSAAGWSVLISTSSMTATVRALSDEVLAEMFTSPRRTIVEGSAAPRGRAVPAHGGYRLPGPWSQGSNVVLAGWLHGGRHRRVG